jgi:molecular chaperone HtpG
MTAERQTFEFQAEVHQVLDLVIHSLYSHKEVFLRELVSNAADALDKLRFRALTEPGIMGDDSALEIRIRGDRANKTLTIEDTGVGMTREELVRNLGTIAHSGTKKFLEQLRAGGQKEATLIGQFGVGFYSAYLVADRVEVESRAAGSDEAHRWSSDAKGSFVVEPAERAARGTTITLHLRDEHASFADGWQIRELVRRYSDFVSHPIKLEVKTKGDGKDEASAEPTWEPINRASALWQRPKNEVNDEQHAEFYKHLTRDAEPPLARTHFVIEGTQSFTGLLYVPKHAPLFALDHDKRGVRLFVRRVFIMDNCEELVPSWLRFVRGVIDSDDLPLNVSRETLQDSAIVRTIRKQLTKKVLDLLDEIATERRDDYVAFWGAFGAVLKEGLAVDFEYRERLSKLVRWKSSHEDGLVSLADYVGRMKDGQESIYYVFGESEAALAGSPYLEALRAKGYEVLYLTDPVDEWVADNLREFDGKPLVSAMRANLKLDGDEEAKKTREAKAAELEPLLRRAKSVLGDRVTDVVVSERLTDSPCCLVVPEGQHHAYVEQLLKQHGRSVGAAKRLLELNPSHPLVAAIGALSQREENATKVGDWIEVLYDQSLLTEGSKPADPNGFARRVTDLLQQVATAAAGAGVASNAAAP